MQIAVDFRYCVVLVRLAPRPRRMCPATVITIFTHLYVRAYVLRTAFSCLPIAAPTTRRRAIYRSRARPRAYATENIRVSGAADRPAGGVAEAVITRRRSKRTKRNASSLCNGRLYATARCRCKRSLCPALFEASNCKSRTVRVS